VNNMECKTSPQKGASADQKNNYWKACLGKNGIPRERPFIHSLYSKETLFLDGGGKSHAEAGKA